VYFSDAANGDVGVDGWARVSDRPCVRPTVWTSARATARRARAVRQRATTRATTR
jgi:hypothetical protein